MKQHSEIILIGGGLIGLSLAVELKLRGATVTVLSRDVQEAAGLVGAGMLAPQAEQLPPSPMLELCLRSRALYNDWTRKLEELTELDTGYWPCGILAPVYERPPCTSLPQTPETPSYWLERDAILQQQPGLGDDVVGGWWFPQDAQVDNRRELVKILQIAAQELGVKIIEGITVEKLVTSPHQTVTEINTNQGNFRASHYILTTGAWSGQLLSIPVYPRKGQMLSVRVPDEIKPLPLKQVLFGSNTYIVPRRDGLIIIGATSEQVGLTSGLTPHGIDTLLSGAMRLYPVLQEFPIQEFWWGFRPETPDLFPILGPSSWQNLTLAVGHYRNGILLAPITAQLIANWVLDAQYDPLLNHFRGDRFQPTAVAEIR
ncbi:Glycine oxidase ThiO [Planktothrix serta PCC 8927]|uniref:glycine oxidase n=1 Tax=Planktothrix serta PCC 8927 TaxID=671068 RepID=A0A7Z9C588_9CYAN|nr:glycine oxidase ThiO [Planktothrix serta]VXD25962.1 Glycine oxidase ThiO [Planktothrix serta PCC 8927]